MAVNAKFIADFTSFTDAVNKAQVQLKGFETGADKVEKSLSRMTNAFSGTKVIQDARLMANAVERVGGVSKLTESELRKLSNTVGEANAKLKALGTSDAGLQRIARDAQLATNMLKAQETQTVKLTTVQSALTGSQSLLTSAVLRYASAAVVGAAIIKTLDYASSLEKLAFATAAGVQGAQRLENIAAGTNTSVQALGSGVNELARRLADGDDSAAAAMRKLGMNTEAFMQLRADDQFIAVAKALGNVSDQGQKAALAKDLFRNWQDVIVAMRTDVDELADSVGMLTNEEVRELAAVEAAWQRVWLAANRYAVMVLNMAIPKGPSPWVQNTIDWATGTTSGWESGVGTSQDRRQREAMATVFGNPEAEALLKKAYEREAALFDQQRQAFATEWRNLQNWLGERRMQDEARRMLIPTLDNPLYFRQFAQQGGGVGFGGQFLPTIQGTAIGTGMGRGPTPIGPGNVSFDAAFRGAEAFNHSIENLSEAFATLAQISGDSLSPVVRDIGALVAALNLATKAGQGINASFTQIGKGWKEGAAGVANLAANVVSGYAAMLQATSSTSRAMNVTGGALTGAQIGASIGSKAGPYGALIGAGVGAVWGWARSNTAEGRMVSPGRDEFFDKIGGLEGLNETLMRDGASWADTEKIAKGLFDAKTPEQWQKAVEAATRAMEKYGEAAKIAAGDLAALARQQQDIDAGLGQLVQQQERLETLAKDVGFSKSERDAALGQGRATVTAASLLNNTQLLTNAGFDQDAVLRKLEAQYDKMAQTAMKTGVTLPESMRPMLERLIELGLLTDESGKKIEDLGDINFGKTLPDSLDALTQALLHLTEAITGVPGTIPVPSLSPEPRHMPSTPKQNPLPNVPWPDSSPDHPPGLPPDIRTVAHTGGLLTMAGLKRYHDGGMMQPYPLKPSEVPFIGLVGEGVLNQQAMKLIGETGLQQMNRGILPMPGGMPKTPPISREWTSGELMGVKLPRGGYQDRSSSTTGPAQPYTPTWPTTSSYGPSDQGVPMSSRTSPTGMASGRNAPNVYVDARGAWFDGQGVEQLSSRIQQKITQGGSQQTAWQGAVRSKRGHWRKF